jgi:hypothetical protein
MRKILNTLIFLCLVSFSQAQATGVTEKITNKLADSLNLNVSQKKRIFEINTDLQNAKTYVRKQYSEPDSIAKYTQRVENTRDSLYRQVLNADKYQIYLQKKRNLISIQ